MTLTPSRPYIRTIFCICALILTLVTSAGIEAKSFSYVIIDPGHGGHDRGGSSGRVYEKHIALDTALRLEHYLKQKGVKTRMTRRSDYFVSLAGRSSFANRYRNAIFVSIHYNHSYKKTPTGIETFYYSSEGKKLASQVQERIMRKIKTPNRGAKYASFYVLRHTKHPSILVEGGFVSNSGERERMKKAWFRQSVAEGIGEGIMRYKKSR